MVTRRDALAALVAAPLPALASTAGGPAVGVLPTGPLGPADFRLTGTYVNAAYTHPMPLATAEAVRTFLAGRSDPGRPVTSPRDAAALFARLINAQPADIARTPSTSYGESFVVGALGLQGVAGAGIVTDILHFDGSLYTYGELRKQGAAVTILPMSADGRIDMNRLEHAVDAGTRLVAISAVSMINGFEHDLKTVCEIAHRRNALVYVDAIQAAGATPIDVQASGVDFLSCSSFKWLMGDFGCGFLYVRPDRLSLLRRTEFGYHQIASMAYRDMRGRTPGAPIFEAEPENRTAAGHFEVGSVSIAAEVAASVSIRRILDTGVAQIEARRQPLLARLRDRVGKRFACLTPDASRSALITFELTSGSSALQARLKAAGVNIQVYDDRFRVSPSVYNTLEDIERVADILLA
jgi:selenocysteine lyase/cysteine desulfurase